LTASLPENVLGFLRTHRLAAQDETPAAEPLAGGVSSDIWRVDLSRGPVCVKRALPRLKVAQVWEAPVERNRYEHSWLRLAAQAAPGAAPAVLAADDAAGCFAMEFLDPARHPVWKSLLRDGRADPAFASRVGETLASIHAATAGLQEVAARFRTDSIFHAIRLEPYLEATAAKHPDLRETLFHLSRRTAQTRLCLVHGDVSPKNILAGPRGPVFLDAECAWYGDPAFDLAFCLNHLLLKCLWVPAATDRFLACFDFLQEKYLENVTWETPPTLEARAASLLPGLFLARVDGKSPVEYVTDDTQKDQVRRVARKFLSNPTDRLAVIRQAWHASLT
jgi:aminoglycoside phosphotransferase (APT) family kinase protein